VRLRWTVIIGGMCYTFYLYHIPIISELSWHSNWLFSNARPLAVDLLIQSLIVGPAIFALCSFWFVLTEKPFMRWSLSPRPNPVLSAEC
jgi:peptidoglycan/LPS O-acetylase OafA/YrhL